MIKKIFSKWREQNLKREWKSERDLGFIHELIQSFICHQNASFYHIVFLLHLKENRETTLLYCSAQLCVMWNKITGSGGYIYFFQLYFQFHNTHIQTLWPRTSVNWYPVLINPKESRPRFNPLQTQVVNIRTKQLSGTSIACVQATELTNEQKTKLNICVLVVYSMMFWFLYRTFESTIYSDLCSTHELWSQCFWTVLAKKVVTSRHQICIVL